MKDIRDMLNELYRDTSRTITTNTPASDEDITLDGQPLLEGGEVTISSYATRADVPAGAGLVRIEDENRLAYYPDDGSTEFDMAQVAEVSNKANETEVNNSLSDKADQTTVDGKADLNHDNAQHASEFIADGDGVSRQIYVSADGTIPAAAGVDDIVLTDPNA